MTYRTCSLFTRIDGVDVRSRVVPQQISTRVDAEGEGTRTESYVAGGDTTRSRTTIDDGPVVRLPGVLDALTAQLAKRNPSSPAGRFNAVVESHLESPAARAAVLRYVSQTPPCAPSDASRTATGVRASAKPVVPAVGRWGATPQVSSL